MTLSGSEVPPTIESGLAIHGGVGTLRPEAMTQELEAAYRASLTESLEAGRAAMLSGGSAVDAVVAAVAVMEDSELFNAGRGSNFDERGIVSMDASVMDGATRDAGSVAGVEDVRHPVRLARIVMEDSEQVMLIGDGAHAFARSRGMDAVPASFFHTDRRWNDLQKAKREEGARPNVLGATDPVSRSGTVGAVARDAAGRLAAATSTGGMANKVWGRVGDSPVVGAGTYASDTVAVSCTGWGEYFMTHAAAFDVHARMCYGGATLAEATRATIWDTLHEVVPGSGGLIAIDHLGKVEFAFNTPGMYRGWIEANGDGGVAIYGGRANAHES